MTWLGWRLLIGEYVCSVFSKKVYGFSCVMTCRVSWIFSLELVTIEISGNECFENVRVTSFGLMHTRFDELKFS